MKKINKIGVVSGRLTVIKEIGPKYSSGRDRIYWLCVCECGNEIELVSDGVGRTRSCGCLKKDMIAKVNYKHGEANKTKENKTWFGIKDRCYNPNAEKFSIYGGRGIKVCDRWLNSYEAFLEDMGRSPSKNHSIDRIDVNGDYEPSNCRWSDAREQGNNTRTCVYLTHGEVTLTMKQWSERLRINYKSFHSQIKYKGKTLEQIIKEKKDG